LISDLLSGSTHSRYTEVTHGAARATIEFPHIQNVYKLYGADGDVGNAHFPTEGHDYGANQRAAEHEHHGRAKADDRWIAGWTWCPGIDGPPPTRLTPCTERLRRSSSAPGRLLHR